jgi:hypothetical protein
LNRLSNNLHNGKSITKLAKNSVQGSLKKLFDLYKNKWSLIIIFIYLFHHFFSVSFRRKLCNVVFLKTLTVDRRLKLNCRDVANETVALLGTALDGDVGDACWGILRTNESKALISA